jgi:hypothetical protein
MFRVSLKIGYKFDFNNYLKNIMAPKTFDVMDITSLINQKEKSHNLMDNVFELKKMHSNLSDKSYLSQCQNYIDYNNGQNLLHKLMACPSDLYYNEEIYTNNENCLYLHYDIASKIATRKNRFHKDNNRNTPIDIDFEKNKKFWDRIVLNKELPFVSQNDINYIIDPQTPKNVSRSAIILKKIHSKLADQQFCDKLQNYVDSNDGKNILHKLIITSDQYKVMDYDIIGDNYVYHLTENNFCEYLHKDIIKKMATKKNINQKDKSGMTPIDIVFMKNDHFSNYMEYIIANESKNIVKYPYNVNIISWYNKCIEGDGIMSGNEVCLSYSSLFYDLATFEGALKKYKEN